MATINKLTKEVTVDGKKYTLQKIAVRPALELRQNCRVNGAIDDILFYEALLEHVVVQPKVGIDDFEEIGHLENLMTVVAEYQYRGK